MKNLTFAYRRISGTSNRLQTISFNLIKKQNRPQVSKMLGVFIRIPLYSRVLVYELDVTTSAAEVLPSNL